MQFVTVCCSLLQRVVKIQKRVNCEPPFFKIISRGLHSKGSHVQHSVVVFCSVLQCVAVCCSVLQCVTVCCSVLHCAAVCLDCTLKVATYNRVLHCVAVWRILLWCFAVSCSVLQCV